MKQILNNYQSIVKSIYKFSKLYIVITIWLKIMALGNTYIILYLNKRIINELNLAIVSESLELPAIIKLLVVCSIVEITITILYNLFQYSLVKIKLRYDDYISIKFAKSLSNLSMEYYDNPETYDQTIHAGKCMSAILDNYNVLLNLIFDLIFFLTAFIISLRFGLLITFLAIICVIPGMIIILHIMEKSGFENIIISDFGLREGAVVSAADY